MATLKLTYGTDWWVKLQPDRPGDPLPPAKTHRICINLRNNLWQKWGGHTTPWQRPWLLSDQ